MPRRRRNGPIIVASPPTTSARACNPRWHFRQHVDMENHPTIMWNGLVTRAHQPWIGGPWARLVGGEEWGRCSPATFRQQRQTWQQHLAKPATVILTGDVHNLRACRKTKAPCATIERNADNCSATIHFHGGGGMLRVNENWIVDEGESVVIAAGDVVELACSQHPTVRQPSGWYAATCHEHDHSGSLVSQTWRFVPQSSCIPMLSPTEAAKHFFLPRVSPTEANAFAEQQPQTETDELGSPSDDTSSSEDEADSEKVLLVSTSPVRTPSSPPRKRLRVYTAVSLRLQSMPELRRADSPTPLPLPSGDSTWW